MGRRLGEPGWRGIVSLLSPVAIGVVAACAWTSAGSHVRSSQQAAIVIRPGGLSGETISGGRAIFGAGRAARASAGHADWGRGSAARAAQADTSSATPAGPGGPSGAGVGSGLPDSSGLQAGSRIGPRAGEPAGPGGDFTARWHARHRTDRHHPLPSVSWVGPVPPGLRDAPQRARG